MKIIDLLNKIANVEEVPKHIHIRDVDSYTWQEDIKEYWSDRDENNLLTDLDLSTTDLNEDIEILEEEKKIPEKLKSLNNVGNSKDLVEFEDKQQLNNHLLKDKLNEVIHYLQYLKSKGEKR